MNHEERDRLEEKPLAGTGDLPREIEPSRDLWPEVEARILREGRRGGAPGRIVEGRFERWTRPMLAAAAIAVVFLAGYGLGQLDPFRPAGSGSAGGPAGVGAGVTGEAPELSAAPVSGAADLLQLMPAAQTDSVLALLGRRESELDPATVEVLRHNLKIIDEAARDIRTALERDPENPRLEQMLYAEERRRGTVLRRAADLLKII